MPMICLPGGPDRPTVLWQSSQVPEYRDSDRDTPGLPGMCCWGGSPGGGPLLDTCLPSHLHLGRPGPWGGAGELLCVFPGTGHSPSCAGGDAGRRPQARLPTQSGPQRTPPPAREVNRENTGADPASPSSPPPHSRQTVLFVALPLPGGDANATTEGGPD